jgi:hypothetical protein
VKKELPWLTVPGGQMKTTLFYGPWQCRQQFMNQCQTECAGEGYPLMGCMWLADLKFDWKGSLFLLPVDVEAGSRYGIYHCCCKFPTRTKAENEAARQEWKNAMKSCRKSWSERFGEWPSVDGVSWLGHHHPGPLARRQPGGSQQRLPRAAGHSRPVQQGVSRVLRRPATLEYRGT